MNDIKQIVMLYKPGYLCLDHVPSLEITISEEHITYHPIFTNHDGSLDYGVFWQSDTSKIDYDELTKLIPSVLELKNEEEVNGTTIYVAFSNGNVKQVHLTLPFIDYKLNELIELLQKMLKGLELPGFLLTSED